MERTIKIEMTIWDNELDKTGKQDVLLYCERALLSTWNEFKNGNAKVKIEERWWGGFTAIVSWDDWYYPVTAFLKTYNRKLCRLHYWNRNDEPLEMNWKIE